MQQARLNPMGHGQALTAQLLVNNQRPAMGPIRTVAPQQLQSRGVNLMSEVQNERAFNRDYYKQKDAQNAAISLEGQRQGNALTLEKQRNINANARIDKQDEKETNRATIRSNHEIALRKSGNEFQIAREKIMMQFKGAELDRELKKLADLQKKTEEQLDDRQERLLKANEEEFNRRRDIGREDDEADYNKKLEASAGSAAQARKYTTEYEEWTSGKNQAYLAGEQRASLLALPRREIVDDEGEIIKNPTDNEYLRYVEFSPEEQARATKEAQEKYQYMDRRIRRNYEMIPTMNITGNYMDPSIYEDEDSNALTPGTPPPPKDRQTILRNIDNLNKRADEIKAQLAQP